MSAFGPNTAAVETFLERIADLDQGEALRLAAEWQGADERRRRLAWRALRRAAREARRTGAVEAAQSAIADWSNERSPLVYTVGFGTAGEFQADILRKAVPALVDAISALVVGGIIDGDEFEALYGPFRAVDEGQARD